VQSLRKRTQPTIPALFTRLRPDCWKRHPRAPFPRSRRRLPFDRETRSRRALCRRPPPRLASPPSPARLASPPPARLRRVQATQGGKALARGRRKARLSQFEAPRRSRRVEASPREERGHGGPGDPRQAARAMAPNCDLPACRQSNHGRAGRPKDALDNLASINVKLCVSNSNEEQN